jgi:ABC-type maltose transport system permease subunit
MITDGISFRQFDNPLLPKDFGEPFQAEPRPDLLGARFSDLGGDRPQIKTYFFELKKTLHFAFATGFISMLALMAVALDFLQYWNGEKSFLPPAVAVFFGLTALFLALVAIYSCHVCLKYFNQTVQEVCKI